MDQVRFDRTSLKGSFGRHLEEGRMDWHMIMLGGGLTLWWIVIVKLADKLGPKKD
jgi:hypothetical protein